MTCTRAIFLCLALAAFVHGEMADYLNPFNLRRQLKHKGKRGSSCPCWKDSKLTEMFDFEGWIENETTACVLPPDEKETQVYLNRCDANGCHMAGALGAPDNEPTCMFADGGTPETKTITQKEADNCIKSIYQMCEKLNKPLE